MTKRWTIARWCARHPTRGRQFVACARQVLQSGHWGAAQHQDACCNVAVVARVSAGSVKKPFILCHASEGNYSYVTNLWNVALESILWKRFNVNRGLSGLHFFYCLLLLYCIWMLYTVHKYISSKKIYASTCCHVHLILSGTLINGLPLLTIYKMSSCSTVSHHYSATLFSQCFFFLQAFV